MLLTYCNTMSQNVCNIGSQAGVNHFIQITYLKVLFLEKNLHVLKWLECNSILLPHLVYTML